MLNQEICKKCISEYSFHDIWDHDEEFDDTSRWRSGEVRCPNTVLEDFYNEKPIARSNQAAIQELPPEWCPCKFEQGVAIGMELEDA